jgi:hypothetical protein
MRHAVERSTANEDFRRLSIEGPCGVCVPKDGLVVDDQVQWGL